jgi:hypothetical protein
MKPFIDLADKAIQLLTTALGRLPVHHRSWRR